MSMLGTLAKVAVGVIVAKGLAGAIAGGSGGGGAGVPRGRTTGIPTSGRRPSGGGDIFGGEMQGGGTGIRDLDNIMGDILGGRAGTGGGRVPPAGGGKPAADDLFGDRQLGDGGLGDILDDLARGAGMGGGAGGRAGGATAGRTAGGGGLDDLLGGAQGGTLGDLLGQILGGGAMRDALQKGGGLAAPGEPHMRERMNDAFARKGEPATLPTTTEEAAAALFLRAMIQAAKCDGKIDAKEKKMLLDRLGDVSPDERRFVEEELAAPVDVARLARQTPRELAPQVYAMSVLAIELDNRSEAQYLHALAEGLGFDRRTVNAIHRKLGAPALYS